MESRTSQRDRSQPEHVSNELAGPAYMDPLLRSIVDSIPALVAYVDRDQVYRFVNHSYEAWFGKPAGQLLGKSLQELLGELAYQQVKPHAEAALSGQKVSYEQRLDFEHGPRTVRASYLPDVAEDGSVRGYVSLVLDITQQTVAEQQAVDQARTNEALARVGAALVASLDLEAIVRILTDEATALCRAQFGAFFYNVVTPGSESYMLYTISGVPREAFSKFPMPRNTAVFAPTFAGQGIVRSDDITADPRYGHSAPYHGMPRGHLPVRSYLAVPVVSRDGRVHGGLFFGHAEVGVFTERDELALSAVAAQAAVSIDNAQLFAATTAAEQRYRALTEATPLLVWMTKPDGRLDYANKRFLDYSGKTLAQLQQPEPGSTLLHPADSARFEKLWSDARQRGTALDVEYRLRRGSDGRYHWFLARGVPIRDEQGQITSWVGSCTDIDDRKRAEETQRFLADAGAMLASSLDYATSLAEIARLAVPTLADACVIDVVGEPGQLRTVGVSSQEVEHWLEARLFHVQGEWLTRSELSQRVYQTGLTACQPSPEHSIPNLGNHEDESLSWLIVPIVGQNRTLGSISLVSFEHEFRFDERERRTAEDLGRRAGSIVENARLFELAQHEQKRAEDASRAKDLFLGTLSHELRTPLSAILGWTRMLQSGALPEERRDKALATIERNARVQVAMIEDVLDLARITSGKLRLDVAPVEIAQVVDAALDTIRPTAEAKSVRLQSVLDPDAGILHGDGPRLQQIVWNLLSNAVKFTPKGGRVYVLLRKVESSMEIVVSDTGAGIPPEFLPHVFERFTQADATRTRQHGGLGLGLSIVKHLAELHGGSVQAESIGPGQGATFTVRLPVAPVRDTPVAGPPRESLPPSNTQLFCPPELQGLHVLVVDDEPDARELLQSVLETCQARVSVAKNAAEAFEMLRSERPQVLVSDIGMPGEDGYSLIRRIRALPKAEGGGTPAVALTAYAHITDRTRALMEGFNNHVSKPAEPQELLAVVAALVGRHRPPS